MKAHKRRMSSTQTQPSLSSLCNSETFQCNSFKSDNRDNQNKTYWTWLSGGDSDPCGNTRPYKYYPGPNDTFKKVGTCNPGGDLTEVTIYT